MFSAMDDKSYVITMKRGSVEHLANFANKSMLVWTLV